MKRSGVKRVRVSRIVLIGLPGSGKSTVGPILARSLDFDFIDADAEVEREAGLDIPAIFRVHGEAAFRELEREAVTRIVRADRVVVAPGGGWAAQPGAIDGLPSGCAVVWLQVSPAEAARRIEGDPGIRPLLEAEDLVAKLGQIEGERLLSYSAAGITVETDAHTPEAVAAEVATRLHSEYGIDGEAD